MVRADSRRAAEIREGIEDIKGIRRRFETDGDLGKLAYSSSALDIEMPEMFFALKHLIRTVRQRYDHLVSVDECQGAIDDEQ